MSFKLTSAIINIIVSVLFIISGNHCVPQKFTCPLKWISVSYGEIPPDAISSNIKKNDFVARANISSYVSGRADIFSKKGYFPGSTRVEELDYFEILTNPLKCTLSWNRGTNYDFAVEVEKNARKYIGRASINETTICTGQLFNTNFLVAVDNQLRSFDDYEILNSFSEGLNLEVANFKFDDNVAQGSLELIAVDEIHNRSPVEAVKVLIHKNRVKETKTVSSTKGYGSSFGVNFGLDVEIKIPIPYTTATVGLNLGLGFGVSFSDQNEDTTTVTDINEREISVTRVINVPPYTSVQSCTFVLMAEDFSFSYTAEDKFTGIGMSASQVNEILKKDGIDGGREEGDAVYVERQGRFSGTLAVTTKFIVAEFEQDGSGGCSAVHLKMLKLKNNKANRRLSFEETIKLESEINQFVYGK